MYTKFLRKAVKKIESMRNGHCGGNGGGGAGHCS